MEIVSCYNYIPGYKSIADIEDFAQLIPGSQERFCICDWKFLTAINEMDKITALVQGICNRRYIESTKLIFLVFTVYTGEPDQSEN